MAVEIRYGCVRMDKTESFHVTLGLFLIFNPNGYNFRFEIDSSFQKYL